MPPSKMTLQDARDLESSFRGRITSAHEARAEFGGEPTVLIPESIADVEKALRLARAANRRVFVRSGRSIAATDVTQPAAVAQPAAAVLSLEAFRDVEVIDDQVSVGAAATTGDVAKQLAGKRLFLPLDDNPTQSVVSAVLSMRASPFLRSGTGFGPLSNAVVAAEAVPTTGAGAGTATTLRNKPLRDVLSGRRPAVITKLVLDADAATTDEPDRWMQAWTAIYERKTFAALCNALFGAGARKVPERVDLSVRVTSAAYAMNLVIVRTTGHAEAKDVETLVHAAFTKAKLDVLEPRKADGPGSSVATWLVTGPREAAPGEILTKFGSNAAPRPFARFRRAFLAAVDFAVGINPRTRRERAPHVRAWAELQLAPAGGVVARAEIADAAADARIATEARSRMAAAIPADTASPTAAVARRGVVRRAPSRATLRGVTALPGLPPTPGFALVASNRTGAAKIPGFKGDVLDASDGFSYRSAIEQYAVSSYPQAVVQARMTPKLVAVPTDAADVATAVTFAAQQGLKVVARSGGHQYCGLSSGGGDTLLMDMRLFKTVAFSGVSPSGGPTQVTVQPGVALACVSKQLRKKHVVIPHGECPLVNLGGHVQTGGIGHQLRSLGATLDWVRSFKMVTRDPQSPAGSDVYRERQFTRPSAGGGTGAPTDDDVFRAVLGGGPSSWGVVTEITFDLVSDDEQPDSAGFSYAYPYLLGSTKKGFRAAMEQLRQWADLESKGKLPPGIDLFLTVVSGDFPRPPALLVETMSTGKAGRPKIKTVVDAVDQAVSFAVRVAAHAASAINGAETLSVIADAGVRQIGTFGLPKSGREFDLPYKKSLAITKTPFSKVFADRFVELVDQAYNAPGLKVVFQGVIGGGAFSANGQKKTTHMQRRDALVQLVFDVFYAEGSESKAEALQQSMKGLLGEFSGGADLRMLWGSFEDQGTNGAQLDMSLASTQQLYYDSPGEYARLQEIKRFTDPHDVFHTSFTVQRP